MKLLETYSRNASVDIKHKPNIPNQYFPAPDKYITIQNSSGMPAKDYDLWNEVISIIKPYLEKESIEIVQIGQGDIKPLLKVINLVNQTNFAQSVYLVKNALLHCGNDSWAAHSCSEDVPCVILYGSTSKSAHSPYFYHPDSIFIESHRWNRVPSFQAQEPQKSINLIDPFEVARAILNILFIENHIKLPNSKTLFIGNLYLAGNQLSIIPDTVVGANSFGPGILNLRADLFFDLNNIVGNLQQRKYSLWLNREIDLNILSQLKPNIHEIIWEVDDQTSTSYLFNLQKLGIPLKLWTKINQEEHDLLKLDYLDLPLIIRQENIKLSEIEKQIGVYTNKENLEIPSNLKYLSHLHYISQNQIYPSLYAWKNQKTISNVDIWADADLNNQDFLNEVEHFNLIQTNEK